MTFCCRSSLKQLQSSQRNGQQRKAYRTRYSVGVKCYKEPMPEAPVVISPAQVDESRRMRAVEWTGTKSITVKEAPVPKVTDPGDAVIRVTSTCICGSDLHMYCGNMPGMMPGDIVGHEFMGIVEDVGAGVHGVKKGDRVAASFTICCGECYFCKNQLYSCCNMTNPSKVQEALYGSRTAGLFGYSHLTGGYAGGQAEFARVPFADVNLLKLPPASEIPDDRLVFLTDILPTAWHGCELGNVQEGDVVAVWGAGPVGVLTAHCAQHRGAKKVILIDGVQWRLDFAKQKLPNIETINYKEQSAQNVLKQMCPPDGPDVGIETVGFHYAKSALHKVEMALKLETDTPEILNEMIGSVRKGGKIAVIGAYAGFTNHFNIGAFMEKGMTMAAGQTHVQKYWHMLLDKVLKGELDPEIVITHHLPLEKAAEGYATFNAKEDGCMKIIMKP